MIKFKRGQHVGVPCEIQKGPFDTERLITIKTDRGDLSGFVRTEFLEGEPGSNGYVRATVVSVSPAAILVRVEGSFFTVASGVTAVSPSWASENLKLAA